MQALVSRGIGGRVLGEEKRFKVWKSNVGSCGLKPMSRGVSALYLKRRVVVASHNCAKSALGSVGEALRGKEKKLSFLAIQGPCSPISRTTSSTNPISRFSRNYSTQANGTTNAKEAGNTKEREFGATPASESKQTIDQFRDGMRKDQGRLSMEADEVKQATSATSSLGSPSKPSLSTGASSRSGNSASSASPSPPTPSPEVRKVKKSGRALIFIFIILGMAAGFLAVGEVGGWIDEYNGEDFKRKSRGEAEKKDWTDISKFPSNLASSLADLDEKAVNAAMGSSFVQSIREKLGLNAPISQNSLPPRSLASEDPNSDANLKMRAAVVLEASKDVKASEVASQSQNEIVSSPTPSIVAESTHVGNDLVDSDLPMVGNDEKDLSETKKSEEGEISQNGSAIDAVTSGTGVGEGSLDAEKVTSYNESYEVASLKEEKSESEDLLQGGNVVEAEGLGLGVGGGVIGMGALKEMLMTEENMNLLKIENEELRAVIVSMVRDLDESHKVYEEERRKELERVQERQQSDFDGKLKVLREEEAKRVMEILKAYELKLEEDVTRVVDKAMKREEEIHQEYEIQVQKALIGLQANYDEKLEDWSGALTSHVNKWQEDVLQGPISELITEFRTSHATRMALINHINSSLENRIDLVEKYRKVAEESAAYAKVSKFWILLQTRLSRSPNAPFFLQLQDYLNACQNVPQLKEVVTSGGGMIDLMKSSSSSKASLLQNTKNGDLVGELIRASQLGIPSMGELKGEFFEAARASRSASLAPQDANAFQHSWASVKEMFISSTSIGSPSTSNHIDHSAPQGGNDSGTTNSPPPSSSDYLSSLLSFLPISHNDDEPTKALKRNWAILQKASTFISHDSLGPAIDILSQLDGNPASLMQPWIQKAQHKLVVQASLDFLASQTSNLSFTPLPTKSQKDTL